jgi:hypothetical protein
MVLTKVRAATDSPHPNEKNPDLMALVIAQKIRVRIVPRCRVFNCKNVVYIDLICILQVAAGLGWGANTGSFDLRLFSHHTISEPERLPIELCM